MFSFAPCLDNLLASLPPHPIARDALDNLVREAIADSKQRSTSENRRSQWEFLLKNEVYRLAETEGSHSDGLEAYYNALCDRLDIVLAFTELDVCDSSFPFNTLQDLLETQTVESCSHIFSWIESRSDRLTAGMIPQKGKALVLLRTLNDLLRRLSKTGNTTTFCGRILTFLSAVFPLGERSGVNLRGEYGPQWEGVSLKKVVKEERMEVDEEPNAVVAGSDMAEVKEEKVAIEDIKEQPEEKVAPPPSTTDRSSDEKKEELYNTFWSLQLPFSRPPLFSQPETLESFKSAVNAVLPVIKEATIRERAMMGSKAVVGTLKRKRDVTPTSTLDDDSRNYFFAKFLTSPELLDLEISDTLFRRQILFQLLILLSHLLQFTKAEKSKWMSTRNRSLQIDFTLEPDDAKWAKETMAKAYEELRQTSPNGRAFAETVQTILEREKNWVRWKNDLCNPFDKEPLPYSLEESAKVQREKMRVTPDEYKHSLGSEALSEIWAMGFRELRNLENPPTPGDVKDFVRAIEKEDKLIALRKQQLAKQAARVQEVRARAAASKAASPAPARVDSSATGVSESVPPTAVPPPPSTAVIPAAAPRPLPANASSPPLHPSLPAKPGTKLPPPTVASPGPVAPTPTTTNVAPPAPPVVVRSPESTDPVIMRSEENKQRLAWLALRIARDDYLRYFGKIGNGDVIALSQEIEKEKERALRGEPASAAVESFGADRGTSPAPPPSTVANAEETKDGETDAPAEDATSQAQDSAIPTTLAPGATDEQPTELGEKSDVAMDESKDETEAEVDDARMAVDS